MTGLISGSTGRVYLDTRHPRVCIRGAEDLDQPNLGYRLLEEDELFSFYELRAAAQDRAAETCLIPHWPGPKSQPSSTP